MDKVSASLFLLKKFNIKINYKGDLKMALMDKYIEKLNSLDFKDMYNNDFLLTWEKSQDEIEAFSL